MRLWSNQAYRGTYQLIGQLRAGLAAEGRSVHVVGSHTVGSTPFLQACDETFREPEHLVGEEWVEHALQVCEQRRIDVFVPVRERLAVAEAVDRFEAAGVRVMVSPPEGMRVLADKATSADSARALGVPLPATHVVRDAAGFRAAYDAVVGQGLRACLKPVDDHGAAGFRVLDETVGGFEDLLALPSARVHPDDVERRLAERGEVAPLLVCELLEGDELSVDVLSRDGEVLAAVPRNKSGPQWTRQLVDDAAALAITRAMVAGHRLRYLSNVQVRYGRDGVCRLLEVNTRAASGSYQSMASGLNLLHLAVRLLLDGDVEVPAPRLGVTVLAREASDVVTLPF